MISVSDVLAVLDRIPAWKALIAIPKRLADLEERIAAIEGKGGATRAGPRPDECPACRLPLRYSSEMPHPTFGFAGVKVHQLHCDGCGKDYERFWDPKKGYEGAA